MALPRMLRSAASMAALWRHSVFRGDNLPIKNLGPAFKSLPDDFRLVVADVGSIGGLHQRWKKLRCHIVTLGFDPLDERKSSEGQRIAPVLIGAGKGRATLHITRRGSMSSTLEPDRAFYAPFWDKPDHIEIVDRLEAATASLDEIVEAERLYPDAIKIDVQGGEGAVLDGAIKTLERSVLLAEIECSFAPRYSGQRTADEIIRQMRDHGFGVLDMRRLKRYRYRNAYDVHDPSLGRGMRAGRLAFCDVIFMLEPDEIWRRVAEPESGAGTGLKATILFLIYGKADLAAATFERVEDRLPAPTRAAFQKLFASLKGDGGQRQQLHHEFDRWAQRV